MAKINLSNINVDATTLQGRDLYRITKDFWVVDASTAVDFNDRNLSTGFYHITADWVANLCTGLPANNAGMLINGHKGNQLFILYYNGDTFIRGAGTNTQTAWRKIAFSGGGVNRCLPISYAILQKGGLHNGKGEYSGYRGAEGLQRPMVKEFRSGRLLQDDIRAFGNGFQQPSRIGSILYSRRCRGKRMHRVAFRKCGNSVQFLWSDRKKRPDLYSLSRRSNVCEGVRSQHQLTLEASQYDLALRKEAVVA